MLWITLFDLRHSLRFTSFHRLLGLVYSAVSSSSANFKLFGYGILVLRLLAFISWCGGVLNRLSESSRHRPRKQAATESLESWAHALNTIKDEGLPAHYLNHNTGLCGLPQVCRTSQLTRHGGSLCFDRYAGWSSLQSLGRSQSFLVRHGSHAQYLSPLPQ